MVRTPETPVVAVSIGRQVRIYHAFITSAPIQLDSPATMTLHTSDASEIAGLAADPGSFDRLGSDALGRLVLIDASELTWQRARYRNASHLIAAADPGLVGLNTLQHWLWQRLYARGNR
jgi:hypothetical protein